MMDTREAVDAFLRERQPADAARASMSLAVGANPDQEAEFRRLSAAAGLPVDSVRTFPDQVKQQVQLQSMDFGNLSQQYPETTKFVSSVENARISHDDVENMSTVESTINSFRRGWRGLQQIGPSIMAANRASGLAQLDEVDRLLADGIKPEQLDLSKYGALVPGYLRMSPPDRAKFKASIERPSQEAIGESVSTIAGLAAEKQQFPSKPVAAEFANAKTWGEAFKALGKHPVDILASIGPESFVQSAPGMLAAIPATMGAGPTGGAAAIGINSFATDYANTIQDVLQNEGVNLADPAAVKAALADPRLIAKAVDQASRHAAVVAPVDALTAGIASKIALPRAFAAKLAGKPVARELANMAVQTPVQGALGAAGEAGGEVYAGQPLQPGQILAEAVGEFAGAPVEVASMSTGRIVETVRERRAQARQAQADAQSIETLQTLVDASKVKQRDAQTFQQFVNQVAESGDVPAELYVDPAKLVGVLNQSGMTIDEFKAVAPTVEAQLAAALTNHTDVRVPVAEFASLGNEVTGPLIDHFRTAPDAMTRAEATDFLSEKGSEIEAQVRHALQQHEESTAFHESQNQVRQQFEQMLGQTKRFKADVNQAYATLLSSFYATQAQRLGVKPHELLARYPLRVAAESVAGRPVLNQEGEAFKSWFGDSKVVDAQGKPQVVYHGRSGDFEQFDVKGKGKTTGAGAFFSSSPAVAATYTGGTGNSANIVPVHLNLRNPLVVHAKGQNWNVLGKSTALEMPAVERLDEDEALLAELEGREPNPAATIKSKAKKTTLGKLFPSEFNYSDGFSTDDIAAWARKQGFDGVVFRQVKDRGPTGQFHTEEASQPADLYVAFHPEQIKSAIGNRGTFDANDPNILHQDGPNRGAFSPDTLTIALLKDADLSTFIHESGHFFLEVQADLASRIQAQAAEGASVTPAEQQIVDDMGALLKWFGVQGEQGALATWNSMTLDEKRAFHEQFARGFEAFTMEGKAPSIELQSVFQRFRAWLVNLYKQLRNLNVTLTDDVRAVMGRMLASEMAIEEAEAQQNLGALFKDAETAGMTLEEYQAYQNTAAAATAQAVTDLQTRSIKDMKWLSGAREKAMKARQAEVEELRREVRREATAEVLSRPIYRAWQFLAGKGEAVDTVTPGAQPIGEIDTITQKGKLRTSVLKEIAPDVWETLSKRRMTSEDKGMHPDIVAELFGYDSGAALAEELASSPSPREVIAEMTDQRMLERYGDIGSEEALNRAADEAVHNEMRARVLAAELKALERAGTVREKRGKTSVDVVARAAKQYAADIIARLKVRDLRPGQYAASEVRASRAAEKAFKAGDVAEAAAQKRNQLVNHYATRSAYEAQDEVKAAVRYFRRFDKPSKTIDIGYREQIESLLSRFDLSNAPLKDIDKRKTLAEWVESQREQGLEPAIPPELLNEAFRKSYKDMTVEEVRGLRDTVEQIEHLGRLKNRLLTSQAKREFEAVRAEIVSSIDANSRGGRNADTRTSNTRVGEAVLKLKTFWASHIKAASYARVMDGGKDGPMWEYLIRTANDAGNAETVAREKATKELSKLAAPVLKQGKLGGKGVFFPNLPNKQGKPGRSLNREAILAIALNTGNQSNLQRLLGGEGWTLADLKPVLDTLTEADWKFVQGVWDYFESFRPQIAAKERRVYGKEPDWIDPTPVVTKFGTLPGGYYPVKYDPRASERAEAHSDAEEAKRQMQGAYTAATTRRSFTKTRVEEVVGRPLLYSLDGIYNGVQEVIHDLSWHEWLIDANKILKNDTIAEAIRENYGPEVHQQFKSWVQDIAGGDVKGRAAGEQALAWLRQGTSIAGLGLNVMSAIKQPIGITQSMVRIGPKWVGRGIMRFIGAPAQSYREINAKSDFMRTRALTRNRELAELRNQVKGASAARRTMDAAAYALMLRAQQMVDIPTWWGAYERAIAEGNDEPRAVSLSDQAVIDAQGSGGVKDLSAIERGGPALKLFTVFYSFMNTALNVGYVTTQTEASKAKIAANYLLIYVIPPILGFALVDALTPGDSGDFDDWEKFSQRVMKEELGSLLGLFFGIRELQGLWDAWRGKPGGDYQGPAGTRLISDTEKLAKQVGQGEFDDGLRKAIINEAGDLFRLPSAQINRSITGAEALSEGKTSNPFAVVLGYQEPH